MNNKGQSLIAVLVSVALMGIIMDGMMSMFAVAYKQQATVQRKQLLTSTQANVTQNLLNLAACSATVQSFATTPAIKLSSGANLLTVGTNIATGLNVTGITLASIGSPVVQSTTTTVVPNAQTTISPCGRDNGDGTTTVTTTVSTQQAQIGLTATYVPTKQMYTTNYLVNLTLTNGSITGCQ